MKPQDIQSIDDIEVYIEGCINDFEAGMSTKEETVGYIGALVVHIASLSVQLEINKSNLKQGGLIPAQKINLRTREEINGDIKNPIERFIHYHQPEEYEGEFNSWREDLKEAFGFVLNLM